MNRKLPYYMAYPVPFSFDDDRIERRDFEYMQSLYPMLVKRLLPYVEEECDRMEYKCSMMYDEYPDKLQLLTLQRRIADQALKEENDMEDTKLLRDLIAVLLYQEICRRRREERRLKKKFY